ncbi:MAG: DNA-binding protein, partial [Prevotella sp.]|nr:DNA-binding protein [Prevotella sp.]
SKGAEKASDFDARHHIRGVHVVFTPETTTDSTGRRSKTFLEGVTVAELPKNAVVTDDSAEGGEG